jgi:hypothetical protein
MSDIETRQVSRSHLHEQRCRGRRGIGLEMHGGMELINVKPQSSKIRLSEQVGVGLLFSHTSRKASHLSWVLRKWDHQEDACFCLSISTAFSVCIGKRSRQGLGAVGPGRPNSRLCGRVRLGFFIYQLRHVRVYECSPVRLSQGVWAEWLRKIVDMAAWRLS